jgi:hypothetical protein
MALAAALLLVYTTASRSETLPQEKVAAIKRHCAHWADKGDFDMQKYCEDEQYRALREMIRREKPQGEKVEIDPTQAYKTGFLVAVESLVFAECVAPHVNVKDRNDFNYASDALWTLGDMQRSAPQGGRQSEIDQAAVQFRKTLSKTDFCERGKQALDTLVNDSRAKYMDSLIAARNSWSK